MFFLIKIIFAPSSYKIGYEESLVLLENHAVLDSLLLVKVIPGSIRTLLSIPPILQNPIAIFIFNGRLHFGN